MDQAHSTTGQRPGRRARAGNGLTDCVLLLIVAAALRFAFLGRGSLWADEIFSVQWSKLDLSFLLGPGARLETNPPAYYVLLKEWMALFGTSAFAIRSLSAVAATLTVLVVYALGRRLRGRAFGLLAGAFLAIDPVVISLGRQARGYPLLALMGSLALLGLAEALRRDTTRRGPAVALFTVGAIGTVLFHYTAIFFVGACFVGIAAQLLWHEALRTRGTILLWCGSAVVTAVAVAGPLLLAAGMSRSANIAWIDPLGADTIWNYFREIVIGNTRPGLAPSAMCVALMVIAGFGIARLRPREPLFTVAVVIPAVFLAALLAVSLSRPLFISRTGAWLTTPICLLFAAAVLSLASRRMRLAGIAAVVLLQGAFASRVPIRPSVEDWREVSHAVASDPRCRGPLVTIGPHVLDALYYEPGLANRPLFWTRLYGTAPDTAEAVLDRRVDGAKPMDPEQLVPFLDATPGAVLIYRHGLFKPANAALGEAGSRATVSAEATGLHFFCW